MLVTEPQRGREQEAHSLNTSVEKQLLGCQSACSAIFQRYGNTLSEDLFSASIGIKSSFLGIFEAASEAPLPR